MNRQEIIAFRRVLRNAIGSRTQAEFCRDAGISTATLSRFFTSEDISEPNIATLRKIAGAAENGVTLRELLHACGYEGATVQEITKELVGNELLKRKALPINERVKAGVMDIRQGLSALAGEKPYFANSLMEFLEMVDLLYSVENVSYEIELTGILSESDGRFPEAAEYAIVNINFADTDFSAESAFVVFYNRTKQERLYVYGAVSDLNTLLALGSDLARELDESQYSNPNFNPDTVDPVFVWADKRAEEPRLSREKEQEFLKRVREIAEGKGLPAKEALMRAIFGDPDQPKRILSIEGIGFYTDEIDDRKIREFLANHIETFCRSAKEEQILQGLEDGKDIDELFYGYCGDFADTLEDHWGTAVSNVIFRETDIRVECWYGRDEEEQKRLKNHPCLVFAEGEVWRFNETEKSLTEKSLRMLLDGYARELGTEVDNCHFLMEINEDF